MKKMTALFAVVGLVMTMATSANAITLRFKFKTYSSGPNIYACNAGITSPKSNKQVCYFEGTKTACTKDDCTGAECNTRCVCTSKDGGEWLMNYGYGEYQDWKDNGVATVTGAGSKKFSSAGNSTEWSSMFSESEAWTKSIKNLSFNLGSELYGAQYYVDVCYRGPQIEYFADKVKANFSLTAQATATDFYAEGANAGDNTRAGLNFDDLRGIRYTELSDLKVQSFVVCDFQGKGQYQYAMNNNGQYNTTDNEAKFNVTGNNLPSSGLASESGSFWSSTQKTFTTGAGTLMNNIQIVNDSWFTPRFCKIRYVFTENNVNAALPNLRKWQRHGAEMCTWTEINETAPSEEALF